MPITVDSIKDYTISSDRSEVLVKFTGRYIPEHEIKVSVANLNEILNSLSKIRDEVQSPPEKTRQALEPQQTKSAPPRTANNGKKPAASETSINVTRPKSWMVTADSKINNIVIVIFDFQLPTQVGFGLDAKGAKELSDGLVKHANSLAGPAS